MNNRVTITFSRDFVAGDSIGVYYSDPSTQTSGYWTFTWVSGTPGTFQVQIGTPTTTTGEIEAIRFASAWTNSLNGFTVTQPVAGNDNQVQITSQTYHFVNVLAKFADGSTMAIPTDYAYVLSTVSTGNKITYEDKLPLNNPTADSKYLWKSVNANEVKTKFNLNDDRIGTNETDIAANTAALSGKADLVGGNDFTGDQDISGIVRATKFYGNDFASGSPVVGIKGKGSGQSYVMYTSSTDDTKTLMDFLEVVGHSTVIRLNNDGVRKVQISSSGDSYFDIGNFGVGTTSPSEKLEVDGNIKLGTGNLGTIDIDGSWQIVHGTSALNFKRGSSTYVILSPTGHSVTGNLDIDGNVVIHADQKLILDHVNNEACITHVNSTQNIKYISESSHEFYDTNGSEASILTGGITSEGNIYERFTITQLSVSSTLSDTQRVLQYSLASNGTLDIPDSLNNKVWEILVTGTQLTVQPQSGSSVTLSIVHNGQSNDGVISQQHSAKLIRTATNGYTLIKY